VRRIIFTPADLRAVLVVINMGPGGFLPVELHFALVLVWKAMMPYAVLNPRRILPSRTIEYI